MPSPFRIEFTAEVVEVGDDPEAIRADPRPRAVMNRGSMFGPIVTALTMQEARLLPLYHRVKITIEPAEET